MMAAFFITVMEIFGLTLIVFSLSRKYGWPGIFGGFFFQMMGFMWGWQIYSMVHAFMIIGIFALMDVVVITLATRGFFGDGEEHALAEGEESILPGDRGAAITSLSPSGTAKIKGKSHKVYSESGNIPPNYPIEVSRIEKGKIVVTPFNPQ